MAWRLQDSVAMSGGAVVAGSMALVSVFDECIEKLIAEIKEIEDGKHDDCLEFILSYPIRPEYLNRLGSYCKFPPTPRLTIELKGSSKEEVAIANSTLAASERRTSRVIKKRKLDGDENEVGELGWVLIDSLSLFLSLVGKW
jgi:hypothetical protein